MKALYKCYPTNLDDTQWQRLAPWLPGAKPGGCPRSVNRRAALDALFYITFFVRSVPGDCYRVICRLGKPFTPTAVVETVVIDLGG